MGGGSPLLIFLLSTYFLAIIFFFDKNEEGSKSFEEVSDGQPIAVVLSRPGHLGIEGMWWTYGGRLGRWSGICPRQQSESLKEGGIAGWRQRPPSGLHIFSSELSFTGAFVFL